MLRIVCSVKSMGQLHLYKGNRFARRGSYIPWSYYRYANRNHHPHITVSTADPDPAWFNSSTIYCNAKGLSNGLETQYLYLHMSFYWVTAVSLRTNINSTNLPYRTRIGFEAIDYNNHRHIILYAYDNNNMSFTKVRSFYLILLNGESNWILYSHSISAACWSTTLSLSFGGWPSPSTSICSPPLLCATPDVDGLLLSLLKTAGASCEDVFNSCCVSNSSR